MFLMCRITESKRRHGQEQNELNKQRITEKELTNLNQKINKLLNKLEEHEQEIATSIEEECVICIQAKASVTTYPCNHCVICRRCFVKTIQNAVSQKNLPLRCVICRAKILRLKQSFNSDLLLESSGSGKYKRTARAAHGTSGYSYGQPHGAKAGGYPKNGKKPEVSSSLFSRSACKKRITQQQAAISQSGYDQGASIEREKADLEKLKVANDLNNSGSSKNKLTTNAPACEAGENARKAGALRDSEGEPNGNQSNDANVVSSNASQAVKIEEEEKAGPSRSLSPELESSRKRIEKLNKLTSENQPNQQTLKARILNYFAPARAMPRRQEHVRKGDRERVRMQESIGEPNDQVAPKKKTTWSSRFQKFKNKTNACLNEVKILLDL